MFSSSFQKTLKKMVLILFKYMVESSVKPSRPGLFFERISIIEAAGTLVSRALGSLTSSGRHLGLQEQVWYEEGLAEGSVVKLGMYFSLLLPQGRCLSFHWIMGLHESMFPMKFNASYFSFHPDVIILHLESLVFCEGIFVLGQLFKLMFPGRE